MTEADLTFVDELVQRTGRGPEAAIPLLQGVQNRLGWLPRETMERICDRTEITPAQIHGVSTFYMQFRHRPVGEHVVHVCVGTACHVKGATAVHDAIHRHLNVPEGDDTDPDGVFTIQKVACLGCCTLAPVVQIGEITYGHISPGGVGPMLEDFLDRQDRRPAAPGSREVPADAAEIRLGLGSCCIARGSGMVHEALELALARSGAAARVKRVGCVGMCHQTPLVEVAQPGQPSHLYACVQPEDAAGIVRRHFRPPSLVRRIAAGAGRALDALLTDESWTPVTRYSIETRDPSVAAFLGEQKHLATEHCGNIDPVDLDEYLRKDGFVALRRCLDELDAGQVIDEIRRAGLRGRGGAGFPAADKWDLVRAATGKKHIVCNGDEGDPGAFMDRMLLESYPFRILEGIAIAARAVGADEGVLYIRAEYPLAVRRVREAIDACRAEGFLGENILGSDLSLDLRIMEGAGAFVCGEETALLQSIEGRRGMPHFRPPYPAQSGLWGRPTLVNNTETFALVPWVLRRGGEALAKMGTPGSKGTKVFALAGKVNRGGLIEVPMGVTLRQIVEEIGGGTGSGKPFKAVQVGGPSGGCVPARLADTPVDYEALTAAGAIMGSGGLVVLDEHDCMVDIARYFLEFTQDQSCGKCTFCRIGTRRMLEILEGLCAGTGKDGDIERLQSLAHQIKQGSLCGLGKTAPNPILSTIEHFRDEYEAHIAGRCPAGTCKALIVYTITDDCIGCTRCAQHCPADAIAMTPYEKHTIDPDKCVRCGTCRQVCPADAVKVE